MIYFKLSGDIDINLYDVRIRMGLTNKTSLIASSEPSAAGSEVESFPINDEGIPIVLGPTSYSSGKLIELSEDEDEEGVWIQFKLDTLFEWDGYSNVVVDVGYQVSSWGTGRRNGVNMLLRETYGNKRSGLIHVSPNSTTQVYSFVPHIRFQTETLYVSEHVMSEEFPDTVASSTSSINYNMDMTFTKHQSSNMYLSHESNLIVPGLLFSLNLTLSYQNYTSLIENNLAQSVFKDILGSAVGTLIFGFNSDNLIMINIKESDSSTVSIVDSRRQLQNVRDTDVSAVIEIKIVSSYSFEIVDTMRTKILKSIESSIDEGLLLDDLKSTAYFKSSQSIEVSHSIIAIAGGNETNMLNKFDSFQLYSTQRIRISYARPPLCTFEGGTEVLIYGSGFLQPLTSHGKVIIRWINNNGIKLTSYGTVTNCENSQCTSIYTKTPAADVSFVEDGNIELYIQLSFDGTLSYAIFSFFVYLSFITLFFSFFNPFLLICFPLGVTFTSINYGAFITYYRSPRMNSFYLLDINPTEVPHPTKDILGDSYRYHKHKILLLFFL